MAIEVSLPSDTSTSAHVSVSSSEVGSPVPSTSPTSSQTSLDTDHLSYERDASLARNTLEDRVSELFSENVLAKVFNTAINLAVRLPEAFPEYVPQQGADAGNYVLREAEFWTCGFFPGTVYAMLERSVRFPQSLKFQHALSETVEIEAIRNQLHALCKIWAEPLYAMADRRDTHDIGFIIMPALQVNWELTGNRRSLDTIIRAAKSLATRYIASAKVIRSWDLLKKKDIEILSMEDNAIIIIDSLCNLNLLYYAAAHSQGGQELYNIATTHATTLLQTHLRPEKIVPTSKDSYTGQCYSTCHVANLDARTGALKQRLTAQGYANSSTWARGQAWAILGYAQTYMWTKDEKFLEAACGCAEYFMYRLETSPTCVEVLAPDTSKGKKGRYTPLWDFDAPVDDLTNPINPLRDSSAGTIAANGMLILSQALASLAQDGLAARFRKAAIAIIEDVLEFALAPEKAKLAKSPEPGFVVEDVEPGRHFEGILKFGTANNNANARKRYANHTLVYGDYYLVEFGNQLLRMGLI